MLSRFRGGTGGALTAYNRANSIVLDLTAIATLCLLGRLDFLKTWARRFVVSQATLHEMRRFQFEHNPALADTLYRNRPDLEGVDDELRGLADFIAAICIIGGGAAMSTLTPHQREELTAHFGLHGAESILLASMPGHVLWTDDRVLANVARNDFGVRRIWTQSALMARVQAGALDASELATAGTRLGGWGYTFTTPSLETLMRAGALSGWDPDQFPLKQALDQFATESVKIADAVTLAAELIVNIYADSRLRSDRAVLVALLLDRLRLRRGGREAIEALPQSLAIRFGLDMIGARELADAIRGWIARTSEVRETPSASAATQEIAPTA